MTRTEIKLGLVAIPLWSNGIEEMLSFSVKNMNALILPEQRKKNYSLTVMNPMDVLIFVLPSDLIKAQSVLHTVHLARVLNPHIVCLAVVSSCKYFPVGLLYKLHTLGVEGVIDCCCRPDELLYTLLQIINGRKLMTTTHQQGALWQPACFSDSHCSLNERQRCMLMLLMDGLSYSEIAKRMGVSTKVLSGYKCSLLAYLKLRLSSLIAACRQLGNRRLVLSGVDVLIN